MKTLAGRRVHNKKIAKAEPLPPEDLINQVTGYVVARSMYEQRVVRANASAERASAVAVMERPAIQTPAQPSMPPSAPVLIEEPPYEPPVMIRREPPAIIEVPAEVEDSTTPEHVPHIDIRRAKQSILAVFCFDDPSSPIGQYVAGTAPLLADGGTEVHVFCRSGYVIDCANVHVHPIEECGETGLLERAQEFSDRARLAFLNCFSARYTGITLMAQEWPCIPAVLQSAKTINAKTVLSLQSLECQRSDMSGPLSRAIQEIELDGLRSADAIVVHDGATASAAAKLLPGCVARISEARRAFPIRDFECKLDAGTVKQRFQVGPVDPTILFVGDLDHNHGADILMKSAPAILKNHSQARFIFVGDGPEIWPLRVYARYLRLEGVVRIAGHLDGQALNELIAAADIIVAPSRKRTEEWPILAGWSACKPVIASHDVGKHLIKHEQDGVLIFANESSCVWGVERVLFDHALGRRMGASGREQVDARFGWKQSAAQLAELMKKAPDTDGEDAQNQNLTR